MSTTPSRRAERSATAVAAPVRVRHRCTSGPNRGADAGLERTTPGTVIGDAVQPRSRLGRRPADAQADQPSFDELVRTYSRL